MSKSVIEQPLDLDVIERLRPKNQRWSRWLMDAREHKGLSRMELAERMGYRKLQRGAAKIARWERGDDVPRSDRIPLLSQALGLSEEQVAAQAGREREQLTTLARNDLLLRQARSAASLFDVGLLANHGDLLLARSAQVFDDLAGAGLRVTGAMVVQAYLGGHCLSLDELLSEWLAGRFQFSCSHCTATVRCHYGGGSPLSGNHKLAGWCAGCARTVTGRLPPNSPREHRLAHILMGLKKRRHAPCGHNGFSGWTLGQYLCWRFSVEVPDIKVTDADGDVVAWYGHEDGLLESRAGETLATVPQTLDSDADQEHPLRQQQWGASSERGVPVIGSLSPLRAGAWQGEQLVFNNHDGGSWHASPGVVRDPAGRPVLRLSGPLPLAAVKPLAQARGTWGK